MSIAELAGPRRTGRKRGNNEGNIRLRSDGRWEARISLAGGKRRSLFGKTRAEVQVKLMAAMREYRTGCRFRGKETLAKFLEQWLDTVAKVRVRATTLKRYRSDVRVERVGASRLPLAE